MELQELQLELLELKIWLMLFLILNVDLDTIIKLLMQIMLNVQKDLLDFMIVKEV